MWSITHPLRVAGAMLDPEIKKPEIKKGSISFLQAQINRRTPDTRAGDELHESERAGAQERRETECL